MCAYICMFSASAYAQRSVGKDDAWSQFRGRSKITWKALPLLQAVTSLAQSHGVQIWVDRRVDFTRKVDLEVSDASLAEILETLGGDEHKACVIDQCVYFGPAKTAEVLRAIYQQRKKDVAKLPAAQRRAITIAEDIDWPLLAEPAQLVVAAAKNRGFSIANPTAIPHDLWRKGRFSGLTFTEEMTLLLAGFDGTFEFADAKTIRLVPIDFSRFSQSKVDPSRQPTSGEELH